MSARIVQSRTLFSRVPTELKKTRLAIAQALSGPTATKSARPPAVHPGQDLVYTLAYTHSGPDASLVVTDSVPALTQVTGTTGPGTVQQTGQDVHWEVPVSAGESVTLTIQAVAAGTPGSAINTATFSGTQILTREVAVMIYQTRLYLPTTMRLH